LATLVPGLVRAARRVGRRFADEARDRACPLSAEQVAFWSRHGYLVLERFFSPQRVQAINSVVDEVWATRAEQGHRHVVDIYIDTPDARRMYLRDAPDEARDRPYKLNDLYLESETVRDLVLDPRLVAVLDQLLEGAPMVCNSLNFERGSQQDFHFDTWYMPPPVENRLAVSFIALEDIVEEAGPLKYFPGSHLIPPYRFSHGGLHEVREEIPACLNYVRGQIAEAGLEEERFTCKAGDVFLWHAQLFHGGSVIDDVALTRRSVVTHYWRAQDVDPELVAEVEPGRYYMKRPPPAVPSD
jgi:phytanoyl-CoA hydroxylase